jgi:hypothetical protein
VKVHELKTELIYMNSILDGSKRFEIRRNDRFFEEGDIVILRDWNGSYFGTRYMIGEITYVSDFEQNENYIVFGFTAIKSGDAGKAGKA